MLQKGIAPLGIISEKLLLITAMSSSTEKILWPINWFWYKTIQRKLTTGQGEDYTTVCLLDYECMKNHFRLIVVDLSRQKGLDANPKAIQQK